MISVIIPSYNPGGLLADCLLSIPDAHTEIIVVDNGSTDGSIKKTAVNFPNVRFYRMNRNTGFAYACNRGAEKASGQYLLFLNQDAKILPGGLKATLDFIAADDNRGVVSGKVIYPDGRLQETLRRFPNSIDLLFGRRSPLTKLFPNNRLSKRYMYGDINLDIPQRLEACTGMFMLVRASLFSDLGGFDEDYFFYVEDIDFCKRVNDSGREVWFIPFTVALHHVGENVPGVTRTYVKMHHYKGLYTYLVKHGCPARLKKALLWLGSGVAIVFHLGFSRIFS